MILTSWRLLLTPVGRLPRPITPWTDYAAAAALERALAGVDNVSLDCTQIERVTRGQIVLDAQQRPAKARRLELVW